MTGREESAVFDRALAALTESGASVVDVLHGLLQECAAATGADSAAVLVSVRGRLELVSSTSAAAAHIEMLQAQDGVGPCVDALRTGAQVQEHGASALATRWGATGQAMVAAGVRGVVAHPLRMHGEFVGGLNLFFTGTELETNEGRSVTGSAFATVVTVVLLHDARMGREAMDDLIDRALRSRTVVEQAKGVLSETRDVDLAEAERLLREMAASRGAAVESVAAEVVGESVRTGSSGPRDRF